MKKFIVCLIVNLLLFGNAVAKNENSQYISGGPNHAYIQFSFINETDKTQLSCDAFVPHERFGNKLPAILFLHGWGGNKDYFSKYAYALAESGYYVFRYSLRGFGQSDGDVTLASDLDIADLGFALDTVIASNRVDQDNIGLQGISLGALVSIRTLANEPRIKTIRAMSTPGNILKHMYANETPHASSKFWLHLALILGRNSYDKKIVNYFDYNLVWQKNIQEAISFYNARNPLMNVKDINTRKPLPSVYISNSIEDSLFQSSYVLELYNALHIPKKMDFHLGGHAMAESGDEDNEIWRNTFRWFDYHLKGIQNNIMTEDRFKMQIANKPLVQESFPDYPIQTDNRVFYLTPDNNNTGILSASAYTGDEQSFDIDSFGRDSGIDASMKETTISQISSSSAVMFQSNSTPQTLKVRGAPTVKLNILLTRPNAMLIGYLYDVDENGIGRLITHSPITFHKSPIFQPTEVAFKLLYTAYDVPKNHKIAFAMDCVDYKYSSPTIYPYEVHFLFKPTKQQTLTLPVKRK